MRCWGFVLGLLVIGGGAHADSRRVQAAVKPYTVSASFREVVNYAAFKKIVQLTAEHERMLQRNLFVCSPKGDKQLFWIYGNNDYHNLPSFVTVDTVLQLYHVFFDSTLRAVEENRLLPALRRLTDGMLAESVAEWKAASDPRLKQAALKNVAYFGVAARALGSKVAIPAAAESMVRREQSLIADHAGFSAGAIFPYKLDYSQFIVRGHYTRSDKLKRYFNAMMWYGLAPFALQYDRGGVRVRADEQIRQSLLLTRSLYRGGLSRDWEAIYEPTSLYVGGANNLTPAEWKAASDKVFGKNAPASAFANPDRFDAFAAETKNLRKASIQARIATLKGTAHPEVQLKFMGQRYIPDGEITQKLAVPIQRVFPSGLDVMAVLGSRRAEGILDAHPDLYNPQRWGGYAAERTKLTEQFSRIPTATWKSNLYWSWLYALKALLDPAPEGYPSFMRNQAWRDKSIHTALASWAELRHDTILYGQQSVAEAGDGEEPPFVPGYVEPNVTFFDRLLNLTRQSREGLTSRKLLSAEITGKFREFESLLTFLRSVAARELQNQKLSRKEHERIRHIEGELEHLTETMLKYAGNYQALSEDDLDMALIADVHTGDTKALEEGVGHAYEIEAIVPIEGRLYIARGAVFSYYEFTHPISDRLTDQHWKKMLNDGSVPAGPVWTAAFLASKPARAKGDE